MNWKYEDCLTEGQVWALILTFCIILLGTAMCIWIKETPDTRTPLQKYDDAYYGCVSTVGMEDYHQNMQDCNAIQSSTFYANNH